MMTAAVAVRAAILNDSQAALSSASSFSSEPYQRSEKPLQEVTSGESLNENTIRLTMGAYRKKYPSPSATPRPVLLGPFMRPSAAPLLPGAPGCTGTAPAAPAADRKSTRLNSSH